jgi:hypothetical protein
MGDHIKPQGWNNWNRASNEKTARYAEYHSTGPGATPDKRFAWAHQLTDEQAKQITVQSVVGGEDHWRRAQRISVSPTWMAATRSSRAPAAQFRLSHRGITWRFT